MHEWGLKSLLLARIELVWFFFVSATAFASQAVDTPKWDEFRQSLENNENCGQSCLLQQAHMNLTMEAQSIAVRLFNSGTSYVNLKKKIESNSNLTSDEKRNFENSIEQYCTEDERNRIKSSTGASSNNVKAAVARKSCFSRYHRSQERRLQQLEGQINRLSESLLNLRDESGVPLIHRAGWVPETRNSKAPVSSNNENAAILPQLIGVTALEELNQRKQLTNMANAKQANAVARLKGATAQLSVEEIQNHLGPEPDKYAFAIRTQKGSGSSAVTEFERDQNGDLAIDQKAYEQALLEHKAYLQMVTQKSPSGNQILPGAGSQATGTDVAAWTEYWNGVANRDPAYLQGADIFQTRDVKTNVSGMKSADLDARQAFLRARSMLLVQVTSHLQSLGYKVPDLPAGDTATLGETLKDETIPVTVRKPATMNGSTFIQYQFPFEKYRRSSKKQYPNSTSK